MTISEHKLIKVKIAELKWDETNPNKMDQDQMKGLRKSMERYGYLHPIVIDQNNLIADGEHRALVYKEFGLKEIPAYKVELKDDTERRLLRQTMNKLRGQHDLKMDADELTQIYESQQLPDLAELIAQNEKDIKEMMLKYKPELPFGHEDDEDIDNIIDEQLKRTTPDTQLGDIYQLGPHRLICADSTDIRSINKLLEGKKVDMVFTDPPYNIMGSSTGFTKMEDDNMIRPFFRSMSQIMHQVVKEDGHIYICCNWRSYIPLTLENKASSLVPKNLIVWHKPNARLGGMYSNSHEFISFLSNETRDKHLTTKRTHVRTVYSETNVWVQSIDTFTEREHFAEKPIVLPTRAIKNSSDEGEKVLDLFMGTGTTMMAAEKLRRISYGCEIDPHYCDIIIKRWEQYTGKKAEKL